jgi:CxxC motif-containing protein (DUF1111 family)
MNCAPVLKRAGPKKEDGNFRRARTFHLQMKTLTTLFCLLPFAVTAADVVPLFDATTKKEPDTTERRADALVTRIGDRVRDRHAREDGAYDHYLSFYWEERTVAIEIVDTVVAGGDKLIVNIESLAPLNKPNFRCFFRGINTVAEYHHNTVAKVIAPNRYSTTISHNSSERRPLRVGDRMEFEFSPFLIAPKNGRKNYYGTTLLYVVGEGIVPWRGEGERLDSAPLPAAARLGGGTTLPSPYSNEPTERFKQMAGNISPAGVQPFMLGRRLHHTDFGDGAHSEKPNPVYQEQSGKLGPPFVARSCIACHTNNGRALPPHIGEPMYQTVVKLEAHPALGSALQPQSANEKPEAEMAIASYTEVAGTFADGTEYSLRKPVYRFQGSEPRAYSARLTPQLVGLGLLEAIAEADIVALADPEDQNRDGISGRAQIVTDPETKQPRLGRFGYKAGQARLSHQIAGALNSDMGVTTAIFPIIDGREKADGPPEVSDTDLANLTRYIATLGVPARRNLDDPPVIRGESLFSELKCAACHVPAIETGAHHPWAELRGQPVRPYTDLLLHDLGEGLADTLGEHAATGAEWRTPPLWGIGLTAGVSGGEAYLHDGRARTLEEAILWHGGEAESSAAAFKSLPAADRAALVAFLKSL